MDIKKNLRNDMFNRQELILEFEADVNPGFAGAKKKISEKFKKDEENIPH